MTTDSVSRRTFTKKMLAGTAAASLAATGGCTLLGRAGSTSDKVALQLYTLRSLMSDDFAGTVTRVAEIGYDAVEFAGFGGLSAPEVKRLLDDTGLECAGSHEGYNNLEGDGLSRTIDFNLGIGNTYLVCPSMPRQWQERGADGYREFADILSGIGETAAGAGMVFCYHNHSFEFEQAEGEYLIDILFERADPNYVKSEVDTAWVYRGGVNPASFIRKYDGRCPLLHMKDMEDIEGQTLVPVGEGIVNVEEIIEAGRDSGAVWHIVEQDRTVRDPIDAVRISLRNMRELLSG